MVVIPLELKALKPCPFGGFRFEVLPFVGKGTISGLHRRPLPLSLVPMSNVARHKALAWLRRTARRRSAPIGGRINRVE